MAVKVPAFDVPNACIRTGRNRRAGRFVDMPCRRRAAILLGAVALAACTSGSSDSAGSDVASVLSPATVPPSDAPVTDPRATDPATSAVRAAVPQGDPEAALPQTTVTSVATSSVPSTSPTSVDAETTTLGLSVEGRPITVLRRGTPGGTKVLVIGVIHGDEQAGLEIVELLKEYEMPDGIELWLANTMNPDGVAADTRKNANGVDLNRNFPYKWAPLGTADEWQYSGTGPASEPETQAMTAFITLLQPDLIIWYHQDYFRISPSTGRDGEVRARYSELTGLPLLTIAGGTYTGVAATWARHELPDAIAFIVELGPSLAPGEAETHARAVLTVASEL